MGRQGCLNAFGHAKVAVFRHVKQTHSGVRDRTQHFLAHRGLGAAIVQKEGPVDARSTVTICEPRQRDQPGPAALGLEIRQVGVEQQIRRCRSRKPPCSEVRFAHGARQRDRTRDQPGDLGGMVWLGARCGPGGRMIHARYPRRLVEKRTITQARRLSDEIDGARPLASGVVKAPASIGPVEMDGAGSFLARRSPRKVGAA